MKIVVCMKQVPASSKVDIDPETGAMKRMSGETRTIRTICLRWRQPFRSVKKWEEP